MIMHAIELVLQVSLFKSVCFHLREIWNWQLEVSDIEVCQGETRVGSNVH